MIKIFIGTSPSSDKDAELVLEYSLKSNSSEPIEIVWMRNTEPPFNEFDTKNFTTPFSGFRWLIPELCEFKGRAIYLDVDIFNLRDIADLWNMDMGDKAIMAVNYNNKREYSVMLMDCEKLKSVLPTIESMKKDNNFFNNIRNKLAAHPCVGTMDNRWNAMDTLGIKLEDSWNVHFTRLGTQPWNPDWYKGPTSENPRKDLVLAWKNLLQNAKNSVL